MTRILQEVGTRKIPRENRRTEWVSGLLILSQIAEEAFSQPGSGVEVGEAEVERLG
jgi:hypothetical protein